VVGQQCDRLDARRDGISPNAMLGEEGNDVELGGVERKASEDEGSLVPRPPAPFLRFLAAPRLPAVCTSRNRRRRRDNAAAIACNDA